MIGTSRRVAVRTAVLALALGGCAASPPARPSPPPGATRTDTGSPGVEAVSRRAWYGKPPLQTRFLDVTLSNPSSEPRWVAISETFPSAGAPRDELGRSGIAELQVFELSKSPRVVLVMTVATGGFWAVRLPAGAAISLRDLPVDAWWETAPASAAIDAFSAREILVGGRPLSECFDVDATSSPGATATAPRDAADPRMVPERCSPASGSASIELRDPMRRRIEVPLP